MFKNGLFYKILSILFMPFILISLMIFIYINQNEYNKTFFIFVSIFTILLFLYLTYILKRIIDKEQNLLLNAKKHQNIYKSLNIINKILPTIKDKKSAFIEISNVLSKNKNLSYNFIYDIEKRDIISKDGLAKEYLKNRTISREFTKETLVLQIIRSEQTLVINRLKNEIESVFFGKMDEFHLNSLLAIPIKKFDKTVGILVIYSYFENFFDEDVTNIFEKLVIDITALLEKLDTNEQKKAQEDEIRLTSWAFDASSAPMIITDKRNNIVKVNQSFLRIMGYKSEELIGKNPRLFKSAHQTTQKAKKMWDILLEKGYYTGEVYNKKRDGTLIALKSVMTAIKDEDGNTLNYLGQYMDISEQKDKEKVLQYQATHDNLTGLPNRLLLTDRIEHAITRTVRHKIYGGLIFIDLDNFKEVNDTLGHDMGDILLVTVAQRIKSSVREEDTVSRIGGDEFIVLLDNIGNNSDDARRNINFIAHKIKDCLNSITHIEGHKNVSTPSIGLTLFSDSSVSVQDIIKQADTAMYSAKKQGKNSIEFF